MNLLDVQQFETYVTACAGNAGVSVQWDEKDSTPRTDGRTIHLPAITTSSSEEWLSRMRYYVKHETSHVVHSDFDYLNAKKPKGLLALINNLLEDHRIDYRNDGEYRGDGVISNDYWKIYCNDIQENLISGDHELEEQQRLTLPLFAWDAMLRDWIGASADVTRTLSGAFNTEDAARFDKLIAYNDELMSVREDGDAEHVFDLACRILADLYDQDPADYQASPEEQEGEGGGSGGDEEGEGEGGKRDEVDRIITVDKLAKKMMHEHTPSRTGIHLEHEVTHGSYSIPPSSEYVIVDFDKPMPKVISDFVYGDTFARHDVQNYITSNAKPMSNKLRLKLQTRSRDRYEYGKKRGKLHNGSLHRVLSGDTRQAEKVFRQRVVSDTTDTAVCLLVDCSGSMSGKKFEMACAGAGALSTALTPINITHSVCGFTNTVIDEYPIVWQFKKFAERVTSNEMVSRFKLASNCLWQNSDGDAIAYATSSLLSRKETRKVLIVLSDGSPAGRDWAGDISSYTKQSIDMATKHGVDVYGIGICDRNVVRYYEKNVVVDDLQQLAPTILSIIDRSI